MTKEVHLSELPNIYASLREELSKVIVGQESAIEKIFITLLCNGHVLLVGVPGLAKTTLVNSFSKSLNLSFNRIQFTPDLMPSDILGNEILQENKTTGERSLIFNNGPIFSQIILADEINRTPPKTQSALLQAMQENSISINGKTSFLKKPFMVLATQNPLEQEGTYPLPEAQLDRFLFSIQMDYPTYEDECKILITHTNSKLNDINPILNENMIKQLQYEIENISVPQHLVEFIVKIVRKTRPSDSSAPQIVKKFVDWGVGPRGALHLLQASKVKALIESRPLPAKKDVLELFSAIIGHRIQLSFRAKAESVSLENLIEEIILTEY